MIPTSEPVSHTTRSMQWCIILSVLYIGLILVLPYRHAPIAHHHLSATEYRLASAAIALPVIAVWFFAFWGYAKLREYSDTILKSHEGPHFDRLASGCAWLAWGLPLATISSLILGSLTTRWVGFHSTSIIITNYIALIVPLIAFVIISSAGNGLIGKERPRLDLTSARLTMVVFLAIGVAYCFFVFRSLDLTSLTSTQNPYFLPVWLTILSVIIPYLYAWFIGLLAAYEITLFSINMRGLLYRRALLYMVVGLVIIIVSSIALQYINSVWPRTDTIVFDFHLLIALIVRVVGGVGFIILAIGANRLKKIEEV